MNWLAKKCFILLSLSNMFTFAFAGESYPNSLQLRLSGNFEGHTIQVDVTEVAGKEKGVSIKRILSFNVIEGTKIKVVSKMESLDVPVSIFRLSDQSPRVVTLWTTGSAYRIRIFQINGVSIREVLDVGSRSSPQLVRLPSGEEAILVNNPDLEQKIQAVDISKGQLFFWDGRSYRAK